jgi:hypothetical protein
MASLNPSRTATPKPLPPPESVVIIPILTVPASAADAEKNSIAINKTDNLFIIIPLLG